MKCCDCKFWDKRENSPRGICRFKTPEFNIQGIGIWPETHGTDDWCSNLRRKRDDPYTSKYRRLYNMTIQQIHDKYGIAIDEIRFKHEMGTLKSYLEEL